MPMPREPKPKKTLSPGLVKAKPPSMNGNMRNQGMTKPYDRSGPNIGGNTNKEPKVKPGEAVAPGTRTPSQGLISTPAASQNTTGKAFNFLG